MALSATEPLRDHHDTASFDSGETLLDDWLKRRALSNQMTGASRTFVSHEDGKVAGFYALASGAAVNSSVPGKFRRNMPEPIPIVLLGRLAVDLRWQRKRIGISLVRDAGLRVSQAAEHIGIRGIMVHAITEDARKFYLALGFVECPGEPLTLVITLEHVRRILG